MNATLNVFTRSTIAIVALLVFTYLPSHAQKNKVPTYVEKFTLRGGGSLDVQTSGGGISVDGWDKGEVEVQMFVRHKGEWLKGTDAAFDDVKDAYDIEIEKNGSTITAHAKRKEKNSGWNNRTSISFHVNVPHKMSCELKTSGGGLSLNDVEGTQNLRTSGGGISLTKIKGSADVKTSGGGISVSDQEGDISLHTSGGGISVNNAYGNISGHTSGGSINMDNIHGEIEIHTSGGSINVSGEAGYVKASTSGGSIRVDVDNLKKGLHLETSGGSITANIPDNKGLDLDLKATRVNVDLKNFSGKSTKTSVVGSMNGGGMPVHMRTSSGHINVNF